MSPPRLNIIGAGRLGQTLGLLWRRGGALRIGAICNRSVDSAQRAAQLIGAGQPLDDPRQLPSAELTLIATPDAAIAAAAARLAECAPIAAGQVVFHASGALPAERLAPLRERGALLASVHPIRAFAEPLAAAEGFAPTFCGCEGDAAALDVLRPLFAAIGAECLDIDAARKPLYHAAAVLASNYLVGLVDLALDAYAAAGLERADARRLLAPILAGTLENVARRDTAAALTGPVARGDAATVAAQLAALGDWSGDAAALYALLGRRLLDLAARQGGADEADLTRIGALFDEQLPDEQWRSDSRS